MSGHNKWSQIKLKKGKTDAKKGLVFSKLARQIANEARAAKGNKEAPALRAAIERARKENMPSDNIERAIKRATEAGAKQLEPVLYEAYGPGGVALIIETLTDNKNKTSAEIKHMLSEKGGHLASPGAAAWAFQKVTTPSVSEYGTIFGKENNPLTPFGKGDTAPDPFCPPKADPSSGGEKEGKQGEWVATTTVPLSDEDIAKLDALVEALEAYEEVQAVFVNAE